MKDFPMTYDGYHAALEWCEKKGLDPEVLLSKEKSTDGFTFISLINSMREADND